MNEIDDIKRRAGIPVNEVTALDPNHVNLSHAGRKAKAILEQISNLMTDLDDELYDIQRVKPELGKELLKLSNANDYVALSNLIFRTF
jgi:hypothetical protein